MNRKILAFVLAAVLTMQPCASVFAQEVADEALASLAIDVEENVSDNVDAVKEDVLEDVAVAKEDVLEDAAAVEVVEEVRGDEIADSEEMFDAAEDGSDFEIFDVDELIMEENAAENVDSLEEIIISDSEPVFEKEEPEEETCIEITVEEELADPFTVKGSNAFGISLFSLEEYTGSFGAQLDGLAKEIYDAYVSIYATGKKTGEQEYTLKAPLTFEAEIADGKIVQNEGYAEIVNSLKRATQMSIDAFLYDHPEVFWMRAGGYKYGVSVSGSIGKVSALTFVPTEIYAGASGKIAAFDAAVQNTVSILQNKIGSNDGRYDILKVIHDYICETAYYHLSGTMDVHSAEPFFIGDGGVVCEGYAKSFKILCDEFDILCACIAGVANASSGSEGHMWNYVQMDDDDWYLVDVTWDDQESRIYDTYFLAGWTSQGFYMPISEERVENSDFSATQIKNFVYPVLSQNGYNKDHQWGEWVTAKEATCTEDGIQEMACSHCDEKKTKAIPATGHTIRTLPAVEATCVEDGWTEGQDCEVCGEVFVEQTKIAATGHTIRILPGKEATCIEDGLTEGQECEVCGEVLAEQTKIEATGHTIRILPGKEATCTEDGLTEGQDCEVCGEVLVEQTKIEAKGHTIRILPGEEATCTEDGLTEGQECEVCGEVLVEQAKIEAKGHTIRILPGKEATCTEDGLTEGQECEVCGEVLAEQTKIEATGHTIRILPGKEATCTEDGLTEGQECEICGEVLVEQTEIEATGHTIRILPGEEATCTEDGLTEGQECEVCGEVLAEQTKIEAKGHTIRILPGKEATCTEDGLTEGQECEVCGEVLAEQTKIEATGHTIRILPGKEATCTEDGLTEGQECEVCGEVLVEQTETEATGHTIRILPGKEATCGTDGITEGQDCEVCGEVLVEQQVIPATGEHKYGEYEVTVEATCAAEGVKIRTCEYCENTDEMPIEKLPHTPEVMPAEEPTCVDGLTEGEKCSVCGEILKEQETVPATEPHTYGEYVVTTEATCQAEGVKTRTCEVCGDTDTAAVEKLPHTPETIQGKEATCAETGLTEGIRCAVCKEILQKQEVIPKLPFTTTLNIKNIPLQVKQSTKVLKVVGLGKGDSVVSYKSSNPKVVKINGKGKITAKKKGKATITVTFASGNSLTAKVKVQTGTVVTKKLKANQKKVTLSKGESHTIGLTVTPLTTQQKVTYSSSNTKVATVNNKGKIVAKNKGKADIIVKSGKKTVKVKVTVK